MTTKTQVEALYSDALQVEASDFEWMSKCLELCRLRLPPEEFSRIPAPIWKFVPWAHRVVIMRTRRVKQQGRIVLPEMAQRDNSVGWVVSVGRSITEKTPSVPVVAPYGRLEVHDPLDGLILVGQLVIFSDWSGKVLRMSSLDDAQFSIDRSAPLLLVSVADIWGPYLSPKESEWAEVQ